MNPTISSAGENAPTSMTDLLQRGRYRAGGSGPGFDPSHTVLLVIDPVNDFLSEGGAAWEMTKSTVTAHDVIGHDVGRGDFVRDGRHLQTGPDTYRTTAGRLNLESSEILVVACHNFDLDAARAAGYRCAFVCRPAGVSPRKVAGFSSEPGQQFRRR